MNCSRCGAHIAEGSAKCPSCGLELGSVGPPSEGMGGGDPHGFPTVVQGPETAPPVVRRPAAGPAEVKGAPTASPAVGEQSPGSMPTGEEYIAPGDANETPGGTYIAPGDASVPSGRAAVSGRSRLPVVIALIVLLAAVAGAALYFLVLDKESEATGPELTVQKYFEALSSGDVSTLKSLYAPEAVPPDASLAIMEELYRSGTIKYENLKLETVDETATDAQVRVIDGDLVVTLAGQDQRVKLSEMMAADAITFKLKQADGNWLIYEGGEFPTINLPSPSEVPPSGT